MKTDPTSERTILTEEDLLPYVDEIDRLSSFEYLLELARLATSRARAHAGCMQRHAENLKALGESEVRLRALDDWSASHLYTEEEKAVLGLSEAVSSYTSDKIGEDVISEARRHLDISEMVRLTLTIMAVNDWINLHSEAPVRVLVVEDSPADRELLQHQLRKSQMGENVLFVGSAEEAMDLLAGREGETFGPIWWRYFWTFICLE